MINVVKATGVKEPFSEEKLRLSIKRAGIPGDLQDEVIEHVKSNLYEDIKTADVYNHIAEYLKKAPAHKAKYSLKQAIMELGPTGYPFEDFVAEILKAKGYETQVRSILTGTCITHEIDVIAQKDTEKIMVEAKFHNTLGLRTDVHVSLYTKARFDDLQKKHKFTKAMLCTNTKITPDALTYALCVNVSVISWSYPENESLRDLIEQYNLYPVTMLSTLSALEKQTLLNTHIVVIKDISKNKDSLDILGVDKAKKELIFEEVKRLYPN